MDRFHGNGHKLYIFCFQKLANSKQAWPECHITSYLLTYMLLAQAVLGNIGPQSFLYGPHCIQSVLQQPWANISQYGPCAQLVRG